MDKYGILNYENGYIENKSTSHYLWIIIFLLLSSVLLYAPLFIYSPVEGHLGYFQSFTFTNKNTINIFVQVFMWT